MAPASDAGSLRIRDEAVLAARERVQVHDNLGADDAASDWNVETVDLNALVAAAASAVIAELPDLDWPDQMEVGVMFGSDDEIADLNGRFRDKPRPTNVLSFPAEETRLGEAIPTYLGDLAFAYGTIAHEARERGDGIESYLPVLAVHGVLHLVGYDHETSNEDAEAMERLEARVLARLGLPDPYEGTDPA